MKGDILVLERHHRDAGEKIAAHLLSEIHGVEGRYVITVSGESGSGKSEMAKAIGDELAKHGIESITFAQDDYFLLPPKSNNQKRKEDDAWLGPHIEVNMRLLSQHTLDAKNGADIISKPLVNYLDSTISQEDVSLSGIKVVIVEGTYVALLKDVNCRVFINRSRLDTLEHRRKRNRGNEINDQFIESILEVEHKIIAGHQFLADIIITRDYQVNLNR